MLVWRSWVEGPHFLRADAGLPAPFVVRVLADGQPVVNGAVQWAASTPGALVPPPLSLTDANGLAQAIATVGLIPQSYNFVATY